MEKMPLFTLLGALFMFASAFAAPGRTTYQAKIIKPDGLPLEGSNVSFRFTILDPLASCVLYVENYTAINMADGGGLVSFSLGMGTRAFPVSGTSSTFSNTFDNSTAMFNCQTAGTYNPSPEDNRKIVMQFNDGNGWQTLPAMEINAVPYAMYAGKSDNSIQLNGKSDLAFVEYSTLAGLSCAADQAIKFNGVSFSCITVGSGGGGVTSVATSGTVLSTGGTASAPVISIQAATMSQDGYLTSLDYAEFKGKTTSGAVVTQINSANLSGDVSGTISSNSVVSVGGKTAAQISASVSDTQAATASATADAIVKRNSSGNATFNDIYANAAKISYVDIYRPSTSFNIRLQAPTSLSTNYVLNLPTTSGTVGQVLSTDGAGNLSWVDPSTGSVVSVSATAPLVSTGGATPTISITQATSSTNGYLSSADWNAFNNKQAATSAAIIATLGYTPANSFSSIDLGSASATGTLAIARLPSFTGDATIAAASNTIVLSSSGVSAGTYTKITVDGKGRVTSSSALASSDVTTALGYTPASASASTQWTTSGTDIYYNTGNVGIGTETPSAKLHLTAGTSTTAPLKLTSGTLLTSPQSGTMEYDGTNFYLTDSSNTRRTIATGSSASTIDNVSTINSSGTISMVPVGSVIVSSTTASTSSNTGALVVKGGFGVAGTTNIAQNLNVSGSSVIDGSFRLSSMTSGSLIFAGANGTLSQDNSALYWDGTSKRLGIGSNSPEQTLSVSGTSSFSGNVGIGTTSPNYPLVVQTNGTGTTHASNIVSRLQANATGRDVTLQFSDNVTYANFISMMNGNFLFRTANPGAVDAMYIKSDGNVGIGTTSPNISGTSNAPVLSLKGVAAKGSLLELYGTDVPIGSNTHGVVRAGNIVSGVVNTTGQFGFFGGPSNSDEGQFLLYTKPTGSAMAERLRVTPDGNVGIGTTVPAHKLDVAGDVNVTGNFKVNGVNLTGGGIQSGVANIVTLGAACSTAGALAKTATDDLVVCDDSPTVLDTTDCSSFGVGALTFSVNGEIYVCTN